MVYEMVHEVVRTEGKFAWQGYTLKQFLFYAELQNMLFYISNAQVMVSILDVKAQQPGFLFQQLSKIPQSFVPQIQLAQLCVYLEQIDHQTGLHTLSIWKPSMLKRGFPRFDSNDSTNVHIICL